MSASNISPTLLSSHSGSSRWRVITLAGVMLVIDFLSGPYINFPVFFVVPVMLAAWLHGVRLAIMLGLVMASTRLFYNWIWNFPHDVMPAVANTALRGAVLVFIAYVTARTALQMRALRRRILQLESRLPVCRHCGCIQDQGKTWVDLSSLPTPANTCRCPACEAKHYGAFS